ncbi:MAG: hypothetical protein E2594_15775 [Pseudomonas sp.]|uniref:hypothetical protein n=1 Tax=Stutzerimonas kunmingensis TaxID=1211807 RepID=UPI000F7BA82E|nr:hypothetical protein [Stutzerimonas kunmingensis]MPS58608.1 hypothetical protein [Pseudomonas sp.]RRU92046.1 hypothetical protein EGI97_17180 [Stutzerimonas xanthomarina]
MSHITDREAFEMIQRNTAVLTNAGKGLEGIGRLLGADESEHHLSDDDRSSLAYAVAALGSMIYAAANEAWGYAAPDRDEWT